MVVVMRVFLEYSWSKRLRREEGQGKKFAE
jgi:hypothetical protein